MECVGSLDHGFSGGCGGGGGVAGTTAKDQQDLHGGMKGGMHL